MKIKATIKSDLSKISRMSSRSRQLAEDVLDVAAYRVEAGWKERIVEKHAIDTGAYLNGVHVEREHAPLERTIADSVEYGIFVEYGTTRMAARPCAAPAIEAERKPLTQALSQIARGER